MKMGRGGQPIWQTYLSVTIVAPYPLGSGPCWGARELMSHNFSNPMRGTNNPRLSRKATPHKSIFGLEHGTSPLTQLFVHHLTPLNHTHSVVNKKFI